LLQIPARGDSRTLRKPAAGRWTVTTRAGSARIDTLAVAENRPAPKLVLPGLDDRSAAFTTADLAAGHVSVVNVFASWCAPCRTEADQLMELAKVPGVALYGMSQKDKPAATRAFLDEVGNPFSRISRDDDGRASIEWGVYGVPETFVVDGKGIIRLKYVGPLSDTVLKTHLVPAIKAAQANP